MNDENNLTVLDKLARWASQWTSSDWLNIIGIIIAIPSAIAFIYSTISIAKTFVDVLEELQQHKYLQAIIDKIEAGKKEIDDNTNINKNKLTTQADELLHRAEAQAEVAAKNLRTIESNAHLSIQNQTNSSLERIESAKSTAIKEIRDAGEVELKRLKINNIFVQQVKVDTVTPEKLAENSGWFNTMEFKDPHWSGQEMRDRRMQGCWPAHLSTENFKSVRTIVCYQLLQNIPEKAEIVGVFPSLRGGMDSAAVIVWDATVNGIGFNVTDLSEVPDLDKVKGIGPFFVGEGTPSHRVFNVTFSVLYRMPTN